MTGLPPVTGLLARAGARLAPEAWGQVRGVTGLGLEVVGLDAAVGDLCVVEGAHGETMAEVVGFAQGLLRLMPLDLPHGLAPGDRVRSTGRPLAVRVGDDCLGRVLDGLGRPLDGGAPIRGPERPLLARAPSPLARRRVTEPLATGISAIDGFMTLGKGQRIGVFAGSGVGKSTLTGMIARGSTADVNVVAMVGERGREVGDFLEDSLGPEGLAKTVVVVATSDSPPLLRFKATYAAIAIAEQFRDEGRDVLFLMDSVTRFATAAREIGLTVGEPPTLRGYPPSLFAELPRVVERLGSADRGSITGLFSVLVEGDDLNEPVSDALRGLLDGHVVLDRRIASRALFPAVDVLGSISRLMSRVAAPEHRAAAAVLRRLLSVHAENQDLVQVGAWRRGVDPELDLAIDLRRDLEELCHHGTEVRSFDQTVGRLRELALRVREAGL
ncbi:MAG: FliI/YscN family ATPase [Planctomycetota bacterium]